MNTAPLPAVTAIPSRPASPVTALPAAYEAWGQWRGNPQHTGYQSMAGRIQTPAIRWRYRLGGEVAPNQAVLCPATATRPDSFLIAPPGRLAAYTLDGKLLWEQRRLLSLTLYGCWDLAADGKSEVLASSSSLSGAQLYTFDAAAGDLLWTSPPAGGSIGAVKVINLDSTPALELLWLPAASSVLTMYTFATGPARPTLLWASEIQDFVSDPYSYSSIAVTDPRPGGRQIVVSGGRYQIPMIVLDASNGEEITRRTYDAHGLESGGVSQLLALRDVDGSGVQQVIAIADWASGSSYMFQGVTVTNPAKTDDMSMLDSFPVGMHYVNGSIRDFDADRTDEILVSRYVPEADRHDLLLLSATDLRVKATLPNFYLLAIAALDNGWPPLILGLQGVTTELPTGTESAAAYHYLGVGFAQTAWRPGVASLVSPLPRSTDQSLVDNAGASAVVLKIDGRPAILLARRAAAGNTELIASDLETGAVVAQYSPDEPLALTLLAVNPANGAPKQIVLGSNDGDLIFLDGSLRPVATVPVAGYYRRHTSQGHATEVAAVADLDGTGRNDVLVVDSRDRVVRLVMSPDPLRAPDATVVWSKGRPQELVAVPGSGQGSRILVSDVRDGLWRLDLVNGSGSVIWEHLFDPKDGAPTGLNFGRFRGGPVPDVVASCGTDGIYPRATCAFDGRTGALLWRSPIGTYWDATLAVSDLNGDSIDDVVLNFNSFKGLALDGRSGDPLTTPVQMPPYQDLFVVDYNGAPIIAGSDESGVRVVNGEDDGHIALIRIGPDSDTGGDSLTCATSWAIPQDRVDDQRYSMPAVAPDGEGGWMIGTGSQGGTFEVRRGLDGSLLWSVSLWQGRIVPGDPSNQNSLGSVLAVDVDGDGQTEFVVGGADGWLYALQPKTQSLLWSLDLGSPVGDPIAADLDNDRTSELLVPAADGYLYAIGPAPR